MKELWNRTFELFRRHLILWVPCSIAGILVLCLVKLQRAETQWLLRIFTTQHSVLGGEVPLGDLAQAQHRAIMATYPSAFAKYIIEVSLFVVALAATKNLVRMILNEQMPDIFGAVRSVLPRWREIVLFSLKFIAGLGVFGAILIVIGSSPLTTERIHELALSRAFIFVFALVWQACLAWLLLPAAIRLMRAPGTPVVTNTARRLGTAFAVASSAFALLLEYLVAKAEAGVTLDKPWEAQAIAVMNTLIINIPQVLLFIALALLALQAADEEEPLVGQAEIA